MPRRFLFFVSPLKRQLHTINDLAVFGDRQNGPPAAMRMVRYIQRPDQLVTVLSVHVAQDDR